MAANARIAVVVLGDVGRSPRMLYHCMSLAAAAGPGKEWCGVDLIGLAGSSLPTALLELEAAGSVRTHLLREPRWLRPRAATPAFVFLLFALLRVCWQTWALLYILLWLLRANPLRAVLVQNPPAVPVLPVVWLAARLRRAKLVVDWHNYGYSLIEIRGSRLRSWIRDVYGTIERVFGARGDAHFCVTEMMQADLLLDKLPRGSVPPVVLYDRPPAHFRPLSGIERAEILQRLLPELEFVGDGVDDELRRMLLSKKGSDGRASGTIGRQCQLLVSSTSWTADEDFGILLDALEHYDTVAAGARALSSSSHGSSALPSVIAVITGRGPQRHMYISRIRKLELKFVRIATAFLAPEDYPLLLGCADLGVCLHTSSSGLDLPMKVVDMYGCGLPVCAVNFPALPELVKSGVNGMTFDTAKELADLLVRLFSDPRQLRLLTDGAVKWRSEASWEINWMRHALDTFQCNM